MHKTLQHDQNDKDEEGAMEINIASFIRQLGETEVGPPQKMTGDPNMYVSNNYSLKLQEYITDDEGSRTS